MRQLVVPTQMTRPPFFFVSLIRSAVSWGITQYSLCMVWSVIVLFHRAEGPKSHMECNVSYLYTHCLYSLQKLRREM